MKEKNKKLAKEIERKKASGKKKLKICSYFQLSAPCYYLASQQINKRKHTIEGAARKKTEDENCCHFSSVLCIHKKNETDRKEEALEYALVEEKYTRQKKLKNTQENENEIKIEEVTNSRKKITKIISKEKFFQHGK